MILFLTNSYPVSIDCPKLRQLAYNLGIQNAQPAIWIELQGDCCTATLVGCIDQRVDNILWYNMNLYGFINGSAIPPSVTYLVFHNNQLSGPIPSTLPTGLIHLDVHGNLMSGDLSSFPSSLTVLMLGRQQSFLGYPSFK